MGAPPLEASQRRGDPGMVRKEAFDENGSRGYRVAREKAAVLTVYIRSVAPGKFAAAPVGLGRGRHCRRIRKGADVDQEPDPGHPPGGLSRTADGQRSKGFG